MTYVAPFRPCCPASPALRLSDFATKYRAKGGMNLGGMCRASPGCRNVCKKRSILSLFSSLLITSPGQRGKVCSGTIQKEQKAFCSNISLHCVSTAFQLFASKHHDNRPLGLLFPTVHACAHHQSCRIYPVSPHRSVQAKILLILVHCNLQCTRLQAKNLSTIVFLNVWDFLQYLRENYFIY